MAVGYFIRSGDKTSCGGTVLEGDHRLTMFGIAHAREGDKVSCGRSSQIYRILGGVSYISSHGRQVAGTLDSFSSCPCGALLIPSLHDARYEGSDGGPSRTATAATPFASTDSPAQTQRQASTYKTQTASPPDLLSPEPGFYLVPKTMNREQLQASLLGTDDVELARKIDALNPQTSVFKAGSLVVLSDPGNKMCSREEALLMSAAQKVNQALEPLGVDEAEFLMRHQDAIRNFLATGSTSIGIGEAIFANHLGEVRILLRDMELLHRSCPGKWCNSSWLWPLSLPFS